MISARDWILDKNGDNSDAMLAWALDALEVARCFIRDALPPDRANRFLRRIRSLQRDLNPVLKEMERKNDNQDETQDR